MGKILVTGCCGFIGMHACRKLIKVGYEVIGMDNINDYYSILLKKDRLNALRKLNKFQFHQDDICNDRNLIGIFKKYKPNKVLHLAAQAGVRYSIENPHNYIQSNIVGFMNILEDCKIFNVESLIYASSSSVYGKNQKLPFSENDRTDKQISIYATTKKSNEIMAHAYNNLFGLKSTGLRFFSVYGPWGRPDMAMFKFADKIMNDLPIDLYNNGEMKRSFTFIEDVVNGIVLALEANHSCEIFNIASDKVEKLSSIVDLIESQLCKKAKINMMEMQPGDVKETEADISHSKKLLGFQPTSTIQDGISSFIGWYKKYSNYH